MPVTMGDAKVSNSFRGLRFKITPRDIEEGQPNDPCSCAAALALKRHLKADEVRVYRHVTLVRRKKEALRYTTTPALRLETIVFDRDGKFYPGEYDLAPGPAPIKATKRKSSSSAPVSRNSKHGGYHRIPNVRPTASMRLEE